MFSLRHRSLRSCIRMTGFICVSLTLLSSAWIVNGRSDVAPMPQIDDPEVFDPFLPGPFSVRAEVEEAIEGGPVIVSLELQYKGWKPRKVLATTISTRYSEVRVLTKDANPFVSVNAPIRWREGSPLSLSLDGPRNCIWGYDDINHGDCFTTRVYVQHYYTRIPAGRAVLTFAWQIPDSEWRVWAFLPKTSLVVDVAPATAANLNRFAALIKAELRKPNLSDAECQRLANCVLGSRHKEFIPIAQDILAANPGREDFVDHLNRYIQSSAEDLPIPLPTRR